jgi:hypothetical protein
LENRLKNFVRKMMVIVANFPHRKMLFHTTKLLLMSILQPPPPPKNSKKGGPTCGELGGPWSAGVTERVKY